MSDGGVAELPKVLTENEALKKYRELALECLEKIASCRLNLDEEPSAYNRNYLVDKVTQASICMERLSDVSTLLTRISLKVLSAKHQIQGMLRREKASLMMGPEYAGQTLLSREGWLQERLKTRQKSFDDWSYLSQLVNQVKDELAERQGTLRRLDSDLRLHSKILELGPGQGVSGVGVFSVGAGAGGSRTAKDLDL